MKRDNFTIGIYKITSPTNRVYIGQSLNIEYRLNKYKSLNCKSQSKLYRSLLKHGVNNHKFEIIKTCNPNELNKYERYYQEYFNCIFKGLNCVLQRTDIKRQVMSVSTKQKISNSTKGKTFSEETRKKISLALSGLKRSEQHSKNISLSNKGKKRNPHSKETLIKLSENNKNSKLVLDLNTGVFYNSTAELSELLGIKYSTLNSWLSGAVVNKSRYVRA